MSIPYKSSSPAAKVSTLVELLRWRGLDQPDRRAYRFLHDAETREETNLTYAELDQRVRSIAARLQSTGAAGERALLLYPAGLDYVAAFFGCLYAGTVAVPTYPPRFNRTLQTLRSIAADSQAKVVLTTGALLSKIDKVFEHAPELKNLQWLATDELDHALADEWREPSIDSDTLAFLQYTSGSTGTPKGVMITHGNLIHNSSMIAQGFGYTPETECLTWLPLYHDMGLIGGVLQPLFGGFSTTLMSPLAFARSPFGWLKAISDYKVTLSGAPNFAYDLCVRRVSAEQRASLNLESWQVAFTGAEPIRAATLDRFAETFAECDFRREAFMPCYGLAEATLIVSCGSQTAVPLVQRIERRALEENRAQAAANSLDQEETTLLTGCGEILQGQTLRIVNPDNGEICGSNEVGEIWVSSSSVAQGYWQRPAETEKIFRARLAEIDGPFLRTSDLGYISNGELFVTGRIDDLIIIRGRNYYPQDIEVAIGQTHEALRPGGGAVFAYEVDRENQLVVVHELDQRRKTVADEVIERVRRAITEEFELPLHAVVLVTAGGVPKTSSGKVRRKTCRAMFLEGSLETVGEWRAHAGVQPQITSDDSADELSGLPSIEALLVLQVAAQLRIKPREIDINQSLTTYGLDSLSAIELAHTIETNFGVSLSMVNLLEGASIAQLASEIRSQSKPSADALPVHASGGTYPLSHGQQSLWFLHRLAPESAAYNIPVAARITTNVDPSALRNAFQQLTNRHAALRTTFQTVAGETVQRVLEHVEVSFEEVDASLWTEASLDDRLAVQAQAPFDLEHGPLLRVTLFKRVDEYILLLVVHHIVADFWSLGILLYELGKLYESETLAPTVAQYTDYPPVQSEMLRGPQGERHWSYWREQLSGELPVLNLPIDHARPRQREYHGSAHSFKLSDKLLVQLKTVGQRHEMTLYMTLLAAFQLLLQRYSGQDDLIVGSPTGGRQHARFAGVIGYFVNTLPIRADLSGDPTIAEFLPRVRQQVLDALDHQEFPFSLLVERLQPQREPGRSPIFDVAFVFQKFHLPTGEDISSFALGEAGTSVEIGGLTLESVALAQRIVQFDLTLLVAESESDTTISFQYDTDLFEAVTIARMAANFETLLEGLTAEHSHRISRLPLLTAAEQRQLEALNATATAFVRDRCVQTMFEEQVARTPERTALVFKSETLTYVQLNQRANQLAHHLRSLGVGPESLVGILTERSSDMVIGLLGILKAGGAYVPLDAAYPKERIAFMLEDASVSVLLTQQHLIELLPPVNGNVIALDREWEKLSQQGVGNPANLNTPDNLAYVIYTSGSTGRPKGVAIEHHSTVTMLRWAQTVFPPEKLTGVLASTSICFDLSVFELFLPLTCGGRIILAENALELPELAAKESVTLVNTVPSAAAELIRTGGIPASVKTVNLAGEALSRALVEQLYDSETIAEVYNLYGPSEDTTYSTFALIPRGEATPPSIGRPIADTQAYVLDSHGERVPFGVAGELYLGGEGLVRGYLQRPALTAEKFVPNPFSTTAGARLYRTGDLVRYRADGELEYLGRIDHQVKIRGFRIELGEVEAALAQQADVRDCVVMVREDGPGDKRIVAYVVFDGDIATNRVSELREALREKLPAYMVPSAIVVIAELPLTANGKLDRRALPAPDRSHVPTELALPRTEVEAELARIWAEVLRLDQVGINDNFFDLGGHSLLATKLISRVREAFDVELPLRTLFEGPTVSLLARCIGDANTGLQVQPIQRVERDGEIPLSFAQQRLWFIDQFEGASAVYNMPASVRLDGVLDHRALTRTFNEIVRRHESLRTSFGSVEGQPVQIISDAMPAALPLLDLTELDQAARAAELQRLTHEEAQRSFDLSRTPLIRLSLVRLSETEHVVLVTMHHIVSDGWSIGVLVKEVAALYEAYTNGRESSLAELPVQYADYATWQRGRLQGEQFEQELNYWRRQLGGELASLELPADRPRPAVQSYRGGHVEFALSSELTEELRELGRRENATLFMVLLAAFQALLQRYTGQEEIVVGTPVAGRERPETEGLIGFFVNTIVLRGDLSGDPTFVELLHRVRETTLEGYAHQEVPFEKLVEELQPQRSLSHSPLFQVLVSYLTNPVQELRLPQLSASLLETKTGTTKFDLSLELREASDALAATINYSADLFDRETIERMVQHFQALVTAITSAPQERLARLPLLASAERQRLLIEWNDTASAYPIHDSINQVFERQVVKTPGAIALSFANERLTYHELNQRANQLAHHLRGIGVGVETLVGICMERSVEMIVGLLGILKAGGAYLPLDPEYPQQRLQLMLEDAGVSPVLTQQSLSAIFADQQLRVIHLDTAWSEIAKASEQNLANEAGGDNLAYVMYTSGSTGEPKGVSVMQRSVLRLVKETNYVELGPPQRVLQLAPLTFDASTFEIWGPLLNGGQLIVMSPGPPSLEELGATLLAEEINTLWLTAGLFHQMVDAQLDQLQHVDQLLAGGDVLSPEHVRKFLNASHAKHLINGYGPTENTTFTCCHPMNGHTELNGSVPIGRPISNTTVYVLDDEQQPVPTGVVGELCIGGDGLARGYLDRPSLTAERFIPHPFSSTPGARLYRTGDRVRYLRDGKIEFVGRLDHQVKLRGFRVEPGEIKHVLEQHSQVREAEVIVRGTGNDKRLVAYVVSDGSVSNSDLRDFVSARLPRYMVPSAFVTLDEMPLTPNGKIDRRALPEPDVTELSEFVAPRTPTEEIVAGIWSRILDVERVGLHDDFFQLGGHSLLATQVVSRLRETFRVEVSLRALFGNPTVIALSQIIENEMREAPAAEILPLAPRSREGKLPLSFAQRRLWFLDQLEPGNMAFNMSAVLRFRGPLNAEALEHAFSEVIRRHDILRATLVADDGRPFQIVASHREFKLSILDMHDASPNKEQRLTLADAQQPFDLSRDPLLRAQLLRLNDNEHVLLFTMHHIISDGWSMRVLLREVEELYEAYVEERSPALPELPVQYTDYAAWQQEVLQGEELDRQLAYWREQLAGAPSLLQLPADKPRPSIQTFSGETETLLLDATLRDALLDLSRSENATLFMTLLATFEILLQRLSGQEDFLVGTPIAGRNRAEIEDLIGFFLNSLALRADLSGDPAFRDLLRRVRETTLGAYAHQDVPFEKILEELQPDRTLSHTPLFQVFFNMLNFGVEQLNLPGVETEFETVPQMAAKFDLTLYLEEQADGILLKLVYNSDLFTRARMIELLEQYKYLLTQIAHSPEAKISSCSLITASSRAVLPDPLQSLDDTWIGSVPELFSANARRDPQRIAAGDKHGTWTYGELDSRSNQLANSLCNAGIEKGDVVVVYSHRSTPLVWALLGIMKSGAAFVLLDPTYPAARLIECIRIAAPRAWLHIEEAGTVPAELDAFVESLPLCLRLTLPTRTAADERGLLSEYSSESPQVKVGPDDLAYLSFTSGTTGQPKAILGRHGPLTHFLPWLKETFGLDDSAAFTMLSGLSHDPLHRDIFTPLQLGGRICIPDPQMIGTPGWLARWMREQKVTVANLTPAMGRFLLESSTQESAVTCLRFLFFVGDVLTQRDVALFRKLAPAATCINFYGSTETQRSVSFYVVPAEDSSSTDETDSSKEIIPLGKGIRDVQLLLLNAGGGLAGVGEVGEIHFRGPHLAKGYKGDPALTKERFIVNPFNGDERDRMYRTGDLGRYLPNGIVEPLGRRDAQVKVRGYRVELAEIESVLTQHPEVSEGAVIARTDETGEKCLVAYFVPQPNAVAPSTVDLREYLRQKLPDYMVPAAYVLLDKLPLTPNGKLERSALPAPEQSMMSDDGDYDAPRTEAEKALAEMWAEVLRLPRVGVNDNFFELGGHSLLGIQLMSRMRQQFRVELPLRTLFETPTIAALGSLLERDYVAEPVSQIERRKTRTIEELLADLE